MQPLNLEEFIECAKRAEKVAVFEEIPAKELSPVDIYQSLRELYQSEGVILENLRKEGAHRYAHISFDAIKSICISHDSNYDLLQTLREMKSTFTCSARQDVEELITKTVGFITYDAAHTFERLPLPLTNDHALPLCLFHFHSLNLTYDYENKTILISVLADAEESAYYEARNKIKNIIEILNAASPKTLRFPAEKIDNSVTVDVSDDNFMQMVAKAKEYIILGDAFQIVISRSFKRRYQVTPLAIYQALREVSPSSFMFYFPTETQTIIGASPERLVRVHENKVTVNPIAGTRKRTRDQVDADISADLLSDKKEVAEHMMLVDLARNDVGAVSKPGSVKVDELLQVKHYSHVSHITSTVSGQLQEHQDAFNALKAAIPAGTLSGAPKIRAMQIIAELEKNPRGLYGGAICRFDLADNVDSCIAIRMAILKEGMATIRTGAGIVYDSNPQLEAQETVHKASALLNALAVAHGE